NRISGNSSSRVDVRLEVAHDQVTQASKHRLPSVEPNVSRASDRAQPAVSLEDQQHVIEFVLRFDTHEKRRISMLLQDRRGAQRALQTVRPILSNNPAKRIARFSIDFPVIWKCPQKLLNSLGCLVRLYYLPFSPGEDFPCWYFAGRTRTPRCAGGHLCVPVTAARGGRRPPPLP